MSTFGVMSSTESFQCVISLLQVTVQEFVNQGHFNLLNTAKNHNKVLECY